MRDIDAWIESELKKGTSRPKIKRILRTKGYSKAVISGVDEAETPYQKKLASKDSRKRLAEVLALVIAASALFFGAFYTYDALHVPSAEEIVLNLSQAYSDVAVMRIVGNSMEPAFSDGQVVFVAKAYYKNNTPAKGDVGTVYFKVSDESVVKRIAALPSEKVNENEGYLQGTLLLKQLKYYGYTVPEGTVIILGDNSESSLDSRSYGVIPMSMLEGKVVK